MLHCDTLRLAHVFIYTLWLLPHYLAQRYLAVSQQRRRIYAFITTNNISRCLPAMIHPRNLHNAITFYDVTKRDYVCGVHQVTFGELRNIFLSKLFIYWPKNTFIYHIKICMLFISYYHQCSTCTRVTLTNNIVALRLVFLGNVLFLLWRHQHVTSYFKHGGAHALEI